jgi:hypothetical protein
MTTTVKTLSGEGAEIGDEELGELRSTVKGHVLTAGDPGYSEVRGAFNAMHPDGSALIVSCSGTADVIDAVKFANAHDLLVAVRGGGHSIAGLSTTDGGMLIDLAPMRGVQVDPDERLVRVQGGAIWADVDRETLAFGLVAPGGIISDTGVAGLTLGGGYGWVRRKYGLSCDNLVEAQVVGADGQVRKASADSNPDLYWALRGGGGNFGIVTAFTFRLNPHGPIVAFAGVMYPLQDAGQILPKWRDWLAGAPDEVSSVTVAVTFPENPHVPPPVQNKACLVVGGVYVGDIDEGLRIMKPLGELGTPLFDLSQPMPYSFVQSAFDALFPRGEIQSYWKSQYLNELTDEALEVIAGRMQSRPAPLTIVNIWQLGGAVNRVGPEETAIAERSANFMVSIDGNWTDPTFNEQGVAWVRSAWAEVGKFGTGAVYLNFTGLSDEAPSSSVDTAFGRNLRRLAEIKATYDPENFFRLNNNIKPAEV